MSELKERWERVTLGHYIKDTVYQRGSIASLIESLTIISKYVDPNKHYAFHAEHDKLSLGDGLRDDCEITDEDMIRLSQLGIHWDNEGNCFAAFC